MQHKDMGLVNRVFDEKTLSELAGGFHGIGHVRYSTTGGSYRENAQPLVTKYVKGIISIAHNGNLVNALDLRNELEQKGSIFQTTSDSEVIVSLIARERLVTPSIETAVVQAMKKLRGSFSLVIMSPKKIIAVRDPDGLRPLCIGKLENSYVFASESCALDAVGATFIRDVLPGEVVIASEDGLTSITENCGKPSSVCVFEYIYFARPDSIIENVSVYESRKMAGKILAEKFPVEADVVVPVPDSGIDAAIGYSHATGIPYGMGLLKNRYVTRTFISPTQAERVEAVKIKLNVIKSVVEGKRVVLVDDSIVRGTTSKRIISMLRAAGAKEVHMRISSPPFLHPCYFGTDVPSAEALFAHNYTHDEMCKILDVDSLVFIGVEDLPNLVPEKAGTFCKGCFTGSYPIPMESHSTIKEGFKIGQ